jgi:hypothetical protein
VTERVSNNCFRRLVQSDPVTLRRLHEVEQVSLLWWPQGLSDVGRAVFPSAFHFFCLRHNDAKDWNERQIAPIRKPGYEC